MGLKSFLTSGTWNNETRNSSSSSNWLVNGMWQSSNGGTKSGVTITKENTQTIPAVYSAVKIYADSISSLPTHVIRDNGNSKEKQPQHSISKIISREPNNLMTSFVYNQITIPHILLWGNAFSVIEYEKGGSKRPKAILPIHPNRVKVTQENGILYYEIRLDNDKTMTLDQSNVIHFRGLGDDVMGKSVIDYAASNLGLGKAAEDFGARFFGQGASTTGVLQTDNSLSDKAFTNLQNSFNENSGGLANAHKPLILEEGLKWVSTSIPPDNAQFLETREFSVIDVARWFNLPPHKLKDLKRATFSNIEEQSLEFVKESLLPMIVMMEQELNRKLLRESEKGTYYIKFNLDGILRGDIKTRTEAYKNLMAVGAISPNEIRQKEEMNPYEGGDSRFMQLNAAPINEEGTNQPIAEVVEEPKEIKIEEDEES
jgi:HK97 family phage portal protein